MQRSTHRPTRINIEDYVSRRQLRSLAEAPLLQVRFSMAVNDHSRAALRQLLELKCVISRQLPKMPRTYICKILFDGTHESLLAHNHTGQIVGGVCFRCFQGKDFAEVVFLAVDTPYRQLRVGSQIMNRLKDQMQGRGKRLLLAYADNTALGFFRKQGFEAVLETATCSWNGYIKSYLEGTLMECRIYADLNYSRHTAILQDNKKAILAKVHSLLSYFPYAASTFDAVRKKYPWNHNYRYEKIPGLLAAMWSTPQERQLQQETEFSLTLQQLFAVESLRKMTDANIFRGLKELPLTSGETAELESWGSIEKRIISGRNFKTIPETCKAIENMVKSYEKRLASWTSQATTVRSFQRKMTGPLNALLQRQLTIRIDPLIKEKESRPKKPQSSASKAGKK